MNYILRYDDELNAIIVKTSGPVTANRISDLIDDEIDMLQEYPGANILYDQTESTAESVTGDDVWNISQDTLRLSDYLKGKRVAAVTKGDLEFGLGRMWSSFTETKVPFTIQLFRDRQSAEEWIASPVDEEISENS